MDVFAHCAELVRARDRDRYVADLFAPEPVRRHLFALHAFDCEVSRIRDAVSEPMLGEIRLQWWHDAIGGEAGGHPVATALNEAVAANALPSAAFARLIEARSGDLYDDPPATINDLEGHAGDTTASLYQLAAIVLAGGQEPGTSEIAGHAGVAHALVRLMRTLPLHAARGQAVLPADRAAAHGLEMRDYFAGKASPALAALLGELRGVARDHLAAARALFGGLDEALKPAFLPLATLAPTLDRMDRRDYQPFQSPIELAPWRRQWLIWRAAKRGI